MVIIVMRRDGQEQSCVAAGLGRSRSVDASLHDGQEQSCVAAGLGRSRSGGTSLRNGQEQRCVAAGLDRNRSGDASLHDGKGVDDLGPRGFGGLEKCALERRDDKLAASCC